MRSLRTLILSRQLLAVVLLALAMSVKALVPAGYMVSASARTFSVMICTGGIASTASQTLAIPMTSGKSHAPAQDGASDSQCIFSALSMAMMGAVDAPLLALALLFILALGFLPPSALPHIGEMRLRPPSHGPPAYR